MSPLFASAEQGCSTDGTSQSKAAAQIHTTCTCVCMRKQMAQQDACEREQASAMHRTVQGRAGARRKKEVSMLMCCSSPRHSPPSHRAIAISMWHRCSRWIMRDGVEHDMRLMDTEMRSGWRADGASPTCFPLYLCVHPPRLTLSDPSAALMRVTVVGCVGDERPTGAHMHVACAGEARARSMNGQREKSGGAEQCAIKQ